MQLYDGALCDQSGVSEAAYQSADNRRRALSEGPSGRREPSQI